MRPGRPRCAGLPLRSTRLARLSTVARAARPPRPAPRGGSLTTTPDEIFEEIDEALRSDPARSAGIVARYQFDLGGDGGGLYHVVVDGGEGSAGAGPVDEPSATISMSAQDFVDMRTGRLDPTIAFVNGRIKIRGDMGMAMKLQSVLRP